MQASLDALVSMVLTRGDFSDVQSLIAILGKETVAQIFLATARGTRHNYQPKTIHLFRIYFQLS